jgi:hypothetical protein
MYNFQLDKKSHYVGPTYEGFEMSERCSNHDQQGYRQPLRLRSKGKWNFSEFFICISLVFRAETVFDCNKNLSVRKHEYLKIFLCRKCYKIKDKIKNHNKKILVYQNCIQNNMCTVYLLLKEYFYFAKTSEYHTFEPPTIRNRTTKVE